MRQKLFPEVLLLMETMNTRNVLVDLQVWLGYDRVYTVDPVGHAGGLAIFWKKSVNIKFLDVHKNLVDCIIQFGDTSFFASCIYGPTHYKRRVDLWERLSRIGVNRKESWCVFGDFNDILHNGEKTGGVWRQDESFAPFNQMINACKLEELQSHGNSFTWSGLRSNSWVHTRLDRCFGNRAWFKKFPCSNQTFLDKRGSDHRPVLIHLIESQEKYRGWFRFDRRFLEVEGVHDCVANAWDFATSNGLGSVSKGLKACRRSLSGLKKHSSMNSGDRIHQAEAALEHEQSALQQSTARIRLLKEDLVKAQRDEETYWWQKSRDKWLSRGDRNSHFFHISVNAARARNNIDKLVNAEGEEVFSEAAKGEVAVDFFRNLFRSTNPAPFTDWFNDMQPRVSEQLNMDLLRPVTNLEIKEAVFSINPTKAPGPDGMSGLFFQKLWTIIEEQVIAEVQKFFNFGILPKEWNYTHLCLIPKIADPKTVSDLRPISLCSVIYKIVSKIMVRRLQPWLQVLISPTQSAFVSQRLMSDNITIVHELVHSLGASGSFASDFMVVKTDMSKAFDRVEWGYLRSLLLALGFNERWVNLIMKCVTTVTYSILINDQPHGMITPKRGLRQGDPLSPFLFVLCTEGLTHLLSKAERENRLSGLRFGEHGPSIHHLLFADDCLFSCKADEDQSKTLIEILHRYGAVTGQSINPIKSSIIFGKDVLEENKTKVKQKLGIESEGGESKYLGLPECFKGSKIKLFAYLKERLGRRISGWHARTLSQGGKEVLIKAVGSALPVSAMSVFKIPKTVISTLSNALASFWWSNVEHKRKIHWLSWEKMCLPKALGGMGFKDLESFNQALLAKQAWRILHFDDCLMARVLKGKYFEGSSFLNAQLGRRPSYAWRSILNGRELLMQGLKISVGNGTSLKVWSDPWMEDKDGLCRPPLRKQSFFDANLQVSSLINTQTRRWSRSRLHELFVPADIKVLMRNQPVVSEPDSSFWKHTPNGIYSVKTGYDLAFWRNNSALLHFQQAQPSLHPLTAQVWNLKAPPKVKVFIWKALSGALSVFDCLSARGIKYDTVCQTCGEDGESINHVLFSCTLARQVWAVSGFPSPRGGFDAASIYANMAFLFNSLQVDETMSEMTKVFPWILWYLWKNMNHLLFEGLLFDSEQLGNKAREETRLWYVAQNLERRADDHRDPSIQAPVTWKCPPVDFLKCNIGFKWEKKKKIAGAAWVVRDSSGTVLLHSRRSFGEVESKSEAQFVSVAWAIESMKNHRYLKVHFAFEGRMLVNAIIRPSEWPSFKFKVMEIRLLLRNFLEWRVLCESFEANRGARLIATSAVQDFRFQSYVATGAPRWCSHVF